MSERDCENCKHHTDKGCESWDCKFEQGMTRKEVIKELKDILEEATRTDNSVCYVTSDDADALKAAINSLEIDERYELEYEQIEPCEDAISRQATVERLCKVAEFMNEKREGLGSPYVMAALFIQDNKDEFPPIPITPQPKIGHWIEENGFDGDTYYDCSECGESFCLIDGTPTDNLYNYCPNCGAKMVESQESEGKE